MPEPAHPIRALAEAFAGGYPGAFLKRDRGRALYVTDAPRFGGLRAPEGFLARTGAGLMRLSPEPPLIGAFVAWAEPFARGDGLCGELRRFEGREADGGSLDLLIEAIKALERPGGAPPFPRHAEGIERRLRAAAAVALRTGRGGGALYACALSLAAARPHPGNEQCAIRNSRCAIRKGAPRAGTDNALCDPEGSSLRAPKDS